MALHQQLRLHPKAHSINVFNKLLYTVILVHKVLHYFYTLFSTGVYLGHGQNTTTGCNGLKLHFYNIQSGKEEMCIFILTILSNFYVVWNLFIAICFFFSFQICGCCIHIIDKSVTQIYERI